MTINGIRTPKQFKLTDNQVKIITLALKNVRKELNSEYGEVNHDEMTFTDRRFKDDASVLSRIESTTKEYANSKPLKDIIKEALLDCMKSDYYYKFEKDWGFQEREID